VQRIGGSSRGRVYGTMVKERHITTRYSCHITYMYLLVAYMIADRQFSHMTISAFHGFIAASSFLILLGSRVADLLPFLNFFINSVR
jgi:hypothetical protein